MGLGWIIAPIVLAAIILALGVIFLLSAGR
jgi:hypothetical protein